jgi:hypothetical protein
MYICEDDDGELVLTDADPRPRREPLLEVYTQGEREELKKPHKIGLQLRKGGVERNLLNDPKLQFCDALFWTASSIEKFMFPYYHAQRLYSQEQLCAIMALYRQDKRIFAAAHVAPSRPKIIGAAAETAAFVMEDERDGELTLVGFTDYLAQAEKAREGAGPGRGSSAPSDGQ